MWFWILVVGMYVEVGSVVFWFEWVKTGDFGRGLTHTRFFLRPVRFVLEPVLAVLLIPITSLACMVCVVTQNFLEGPKRRSLLRMIANLFGCHD